jgi:hypothetical protein
MATRPSYIPGDYQLDPTAKGWTPGSFAVGTDIYSKPLVPGAPPATGGTPPPALLDKTAANLTSAANGELPPDVIEQLRRHAAEFGLSAGLPGSEFAGYAGLKQLGLTSLARQDMATQATLPWFMTPQQVSAQTQQNQIIGNQNANDIYARNAAYQANGAARWDAQKGGPASVMSGAAMPGSGVNYGGPAGARTTGAQPAPDYSNDVSSFISKYLPGASSKGLYNFQSGDIGDTTPVNVDSGVASTDLNDDLDWYD